ncbi:MAG: L,D-transpeptidase family protein, partial [Bradymonadaceae bacterium]
GSSKDSSSDESSGDDKSALEKEFPYLDPKTGKVDASTTDPDNVPKWYEENDYEVKFPGKKWEYVRQTQGDHNALGRVKVIFPNQHAVYLHDTPKKQLFSRKIRAFSHGCMRMKKPLEFAQTLLKIDGSFDEVNVPQLLRGQEKPVKNDKGEPTGETEIKYTYKPVFLDKKVPVHVEYFTVLVGDNGRANFYADIYNKDKRKLIPDYEPEVDKDSG